MPHKSSSRYVASVDVRRAVCVNAVVEINVLHYNVAVYVRSVNGVLGNLLLHSCWRTLGHSLSEESQVQGYRIGSSIPTVKVASLLESNASLFAIGLAYTTMQ